MDNELLCDRLNGLDEFIESTMKEWRVPGLALSVVKDGGVACARGYGFRDPEKGLEMNADTLYRIASNTKAFTALSSAMLVDEGRLAWDTPVKEYLPYFKLQDPYATDQVTLRDLLSHRTGLPAHSKALLQFRSRREIVENLRYLEPSCPIRTKHQYSNLMFITAGHLVEVVAGQSWESFVKERIFDALGMEKSNFSFPTSCLSGNFAECYSIKGDELQRYTEGPGAYPGHLSFRNPAEGISSTAKELAAWMVLQLNGGEYRGKRLASEKAFYEMHSPQMVDNWNSPYPEHGESSCGLGWFIWGYRGHKVVLHEGCYGSQIYLLPQKKLGIACLPTRKSPAAEIVICHLLDRVLGLAPVDWNERKRKEAAAALKNRQTPVAARKPGTKPSHALTEYGGIFRHPAYGALDIRTDGKKLFLRENGAGERELRHYHYDTFELLDEDGEGVFKLTFQTDAGGNVFSATAPRESGVREIVYKKVCK